MNNGFFIDNRKNFTDKMENNTVSIITSGECIISSADECYDFEVGRNFYYLTGIDFPSVKLVVEKFGDNKRVLLFVPYKDETKEKWTGIIPDKCEFGIISGIEEESIFYKDEFENYLDELSENEMLNGIYLSYTEPEKYIPDTADNILYYEICDRLCNKPIFDLSEIMTNLRKVKTESEINQISESAKITNEALNCIMQSIRPDIKEYEISSLFDYIAHKNNCRLAFATIAASGENATILHYTSSQATLKSGDMLLIDCGCAKEMYNSDVTRTYPVNGKFSEEQKLFYNIVLSANKLVIQNIKPGETLKSLNDMVKVFFVKKLKEVGLIKSDEEVSKYYYHSVSHSLGLDTHDIFDRGDVLLPGMVITVEPGIYIKELSLGIRIEDDVVVTDCGCKVLTDFIPKEISEIESIMAQS